MVQYKKALLLAILFCFSLIAYSQPTTTIDNSLYGKYIGEYTLVFQDIKKQSTIKDVLANEDWFKKNERPVINLGITENYNWVKFNVINQYEAKKLLLTIEYPIIDEVKLYVVHADNSIDSAEVKENAPISSRTFQHQFYVFNLNLKTDEKATCYIRFYSHKLILAPMTVSGEETVMKTIGNSDLLSGIYFGIILVMLLYNLFIFFTVRDKSYLVYVQYIFWVGLAQATLLGYGHRFLWVDSEWFTKNMLYITGAGSGIATVIFTKSFLQSKKNIPKLDKLLTLIIVGDLIALTLLVLGYRIHSYNAINATAGIGSLIVIYCAAVLHKNKFRPAKYFLIAYSVFLFGVIVFVVKDYSGLTYNLFTSHSMQLGSAIEAMLLSFALADKINVFRKEKEESQAQALEALKENERIIREQNTMLEGKVNERTYELKVSNEGLEKAMTELKETQSQLVEKEKMASLGQLTAGIAHEINNPINFVTANVKPLNRDVYILLDTIAAIEQVATDNTTTDEKKRVIEDYKMEIDYDYLKLEIDQLLHGIGDGAARTAEIVKGLRIFSRLDEDDLKKADVNEGLDSTMVIANNLLNNTIKLEKKYANIPLIECYPGKLNQVFLNIITNAIYAIKKRHPNGEGGMLSITTEHKDDHVFVTIGDNGTGMDEHTKKRLFEPFFTTKDVGEGTGLGLSISYNTINKHNGTITVNSELNVGTEFIIKLPLEHKFVNQATQ